MDVCKAKRAAVIYKDMFVPMYINKMHFRKQWPYINKVLFPGYFLVDIENISSVLKGMKHVNWFIKVLRISDMVSSIRKEEQEFLQSMMN